MAAFLQLLPFPATANPNWVTSFKFAKSKGNTTLGEMLERHFTNHVDAHYAQCGMPELEINLRSSNLSLIPPRLQSLPLDTELFIATSTPEDLLRFLFLQQTPGDWERNHLDRSRFLKQDPIYRASIFITGASKAFSNTCLDTLNHATKTKLLDKLSTVSAAINTINSQPSDGTISALEATFLTPLGYALDEPDASSERRLSAYFYIWDFYRRNKQFSDDSKELSYVSTFRGIAIGQSLKLVGSSKKPASLDNVPSASSAESLISLVSLEHGGVEPSVYLLASPTFKPLPKPAVISALIKDHKPHLNFAPSQSTLIASDVPLFFWYEVEGVPAEFCKSKDDWVLERPDVRATGYRLESSQAPITLERIEHTGFACRIHIKFKLLPTSNSDGKGLDFPEKVLVTFNLTYGKTIGTEKLYFPISERFDTTREPLLLTPSTNCNLKHEYTPVRKSPFIEMTSANMEELRKNYTANIKGVLSWESIIRLRDEGNLVDKSTPPTIAECSVICNNKSLSTTCDAYWSEGLLVAFATQEISPPPTLRAGNNRMMLCTANFWIDLKLKIADGSHKVQKTSKSGVILCPPLTLPLPALDIPIREKGSSTNHTPTRKKVSSTGPEKTASPQQEPLR